MYLHQNSPSIHDRIMEGKNGHKLFLILHSCPCNHAFGAPPIKGGKFSPSFDSVPALILALATGK